MDMCEKNLNYLHHDGSVQEELGKENSRSNCKSRSRPQSSVTTNINKITGGALLTKRPLTKGTHFKNVSPKQFKPILPKPQNLRDIISCNINNIMSGKPIPPLVAISDKKNISRNNITPEKSSSTSNTSEKPSIINKTTKDLLTPDSSVIKFFDPEKRQILFLKKVDPPPTVPFHLKSIQAEDGVENLNNPLDSPIIKKKRIVQHKGPSETGVSILKKNCHLDGVTKNAPVKFLKSMKYISLNINSQQDDLIVNNPPPLISLPKTENPPEVKNLKKIKIIQKPKNMITPSKIIIRKPEKVENNNLTIPSSQDVVNEPSRKLNSFQGIEKPLRVLAHSKSCPFAVKSVDNQLMGVNNKTSNAQDCLRVLPANVNAGNNPVVPSMIALSNRPKVSDKVKCIAEGSGQDKLNVSVESICKTQVSALAIPQQKDLTNLSTSKTTQDKKNISRNNITPEKSSSTSNTSEKPSIINMTTKDPLTPDSSVIKFFDPDGVENLNNSLDSSIIKDNGIVQHKGPSENGDTILKKNCYLDGVTKNAPVKFSKSMKNISLNINSQQNDLVVNNPPPLICLPKTENPPEVKNLKKIKIIQKPKNMITPSKIIIRKPEKIENDNLTTPSSQDVVNEPSRKLNSFQGIEKPLRVLAHSKSCPFAVKSVDNQLMGVNNKTSNAQDCLRVLPANVNAGNNPVVPSMIALSNRPKVSDKVKCIAEGSGQDKLNVSVESICKTQVSALAIPQQKDLTNLSTSKTTQGEKTNDSSRYNQITCTDTSRSFLLANSMDANSSNQNHIQKETSNSKRLPKKTSRIFNETGISLSSSMINPSHDNQKFDSDSCSRSKHQPKRKVCVIPLKEVVSSALSKPRIQELIAEQFGVRVPYGSKLFKVFSRKIKRFKSSYLRKVKRHNNREKNKGKLRKQRQKSSGGNHMNVATKGTESENSNGLAARVDSEFKCTNMDETSSDGPSEKEGNLPQMLQKKKFAHSDKHSGKSRPKQQARKIPPRSMGVKFIGHSTNRRSLENQLNCDDAEIGTVFNIPTSIANIYDKSQLEALCQTFIEALHRLKDTDSDDGEWKLVVSIVKGNENKSLVSNNCNTQSKSIILENPALHTVLESSMSVGMGTLDNINSEVDLFEPQGNSLLNTLTSLKTNNDPLSMGNLMCDDVTMTGSSFPLTSVSGINLGKSLSLSKYSGASSDKLGSAVIEIAATASTCHDHSYSPDAFRIFKNPRYLVKIIENTAKGKKGKRVVSKPPSKQLEKKFEREKLRLQKHIYKLTSKVKSKNYHILEKNKKIKYLSNIICQQKGVKRVRYPKKKKEEVISASNNSVSNNESLQSTTNPERVWEVRPALDLNNKSKNAIAIQNEVNNAVNNLLDEEVYNEDNFEKRFDELYQRLVESATSGP